MSRLLAMIVDVVVLGLASAWIGWFLDAFESMLRPWTPRLDLDPLVFFSVPLFSAIYFVALWTATGQTVGKWLLGLRVVAEDGSRLRLGRSLLRLLGYVVSAIPLYAGFAMILFDRQRRGLHDRIAHTRVLYTAPRQGLTGGAGRRLTG